MCRRYPTNSIGLARHVRQRIISIFRTNLDLVDRPIRSVLPGLEKLSSRIQEAIRRGIELRHIGLQRMSAELFDIYRHRRGKRLRTQNVESRHIAFDVREQRQSVFSTCLVRGHQRGGVRDRGVWTGQMCDLYLFRHLPNLRILSLSEGSWLKQSRVPPTATMGVTGTGDFTRGLPRSRRLLVLERHEVVRQF